MLERPCSNAISRIGTCTPVGPSTKIFRELGNAEVNSDIPHSLRRFQPGQVPRVCLNPTNGIPLAAWSLTIARGTPLAVFARAPPFMRAALLSRRAVWLALLACGGVELAVAIWDLAGHSFYYEVLGLRISSWEAYKPFRVGMTAIVVALWLHDHDAPSRATWHRLTRLAPW